MADLIMDIGEMAGKVWRHLAAEGRQPLSEVVRALEESADRVHMAVGWLAREGKINLGTEAGEITVALRERGESW
jgi:hypothetical protein